MNFEIPLVGNDDMTKRAKAVKPLVREDGKLREIKPVDLYAVSFLWDPKLKHVIDEDTLQIITKARTLHRFGYHGFFKPSVSEILAQLPDLILRRVDSGVQMFFETEGPKDVYDLNLEKEALNKGFHVAKTTFYIREEDFNRWLQS